MSRGRSSWADQRAAWDCPVLVWNHEAPSVSVAFFFETMQHRKDHAGMLNMICCLYVRTVSKTLELALKTELALRNTSSTLQPSTNGTMILRITSSPTMCPWYLCWGSQPCWAFWNCFECISLYCINARHRRMVWCKLIRHVWQLWPVSTWPCCWDVWVNWYPRHAKPLHCIISIPPDTWTVVSSRIHIDCLSNDKSWPRKALMFQASSDLPHVHLRMPWNDFLSLVWRPVQCSLGCAECLFDRGSFIMRVLLLCRSYWTSSFCRDNNASQPHCCSGRRKSQAFHAHTLIAWRIWVSGTEWRQSFGVNLWNWNLESADDVGNIFSVAFRFSWGLVRNGMTIARFGRVDDNRSWFKLPLQSNRTILAIVDSFMWRNPDDMAPARPRVNDDNRSETSTINTIPKERVNHNQYTKRKALNALANGPSSTKPAPLIPQPTAPAEPVEPPHVRLLQLASSILTSSGWLDSSFTRYSLFISISLSITNTIVIQKSSRRHSLQIELCSEKGTFTVSCKKKESRSETISE